MKKILFIMATAALFLSFGCNTVDDWGDGRAEMEHVYYVGFYKTNINADALSYQIDPDGTARWRYASVAWILTEEPFVASIPFQFHSERVRSYDAVTYFWVVNSAGALTAGTDYSIMLDNGTTLTPDGNGVYALTWPQAKKGIQNVKVKRLTTTAPGALKFYVINPANGVPDPNQYETSTRNNKTDEYEVRGFSFDYNKVTVTFN